MTDKRINLTRDGSLADGVTVTTFDIPMTSGTLLEANASFMFEINIVIHQVNASISMGGRWGLFARRSASVTTTTATIVDWNDSSGILLASSVVGNNIRLTMTLPYIGGNKYWRAFITAYVKDNTI